MQDFSQHQQFSEQEKLKCPRCESTNTKFCYYNNYNLSQPRHFCKSCKRYWTKGGALRNVPVGGGSRKNAKRASSSAAAKRPPPASSSAPAPPDETLLPLEKVDGPGPGLGQGQFGNFEGSLLPVTRGDDFGQGQFGSFLGMSGSFSSLLVGSSSGAQFGGLLDGLGPNGPHLRAGDHFGDMGLGQNVDTQSDGFLNIDGSRGGDGGCWGGSGGGDWPDLAI